MWSCEYTVCNAYFNIFLCALTGGMMIFFFNISPDTFLPNYNHFKAALFLGLSMMCLMTLICLFFRYLFILAYLIENDLRK